MSLGFMGWRPVGRLRKRDAATALPFQPSTDKGGCMVQGTRGSDRSQVAAAQSIFFVKIEQEMPKHRASAKINNNHKKSVEPACANQNLVKPVLSVPVNMVYVVQIGQPDLIQIQRVDIRPYVHCSFRSGGDVRHRLCKAGLELVFLKSASDDHRAF